MGDRCYFSVWVRTADAASKAGRTILDEWVGGSAEDTDGPLQEWVHEEMNYGGIDFLEAWNAAGFMCHGFHTAGGSYGPGEFHTTGRVRWRGGGSTCPSRPTERRGVSFVSTSTGGTGYLVDFSPDGEPEALSLAEVKDFILQEKKIKAAMYETPIEQLAAAHNTERDEE